MATDIKTSIDALNDEINACSAALSESLKVAPVTETTKLSNGLKTMAQLVNKLENSRALTYAQLSNLDQKASDNSINITNLQDSEI